MSRISLPFRHWRFRGYLHSFPEYHPCSMVLGDFSGDGVVNAQDIDGFVGVLFVP